MFTNSLSRLSTGLKMLIILSAALLPLGMIAVFASMESAKTNRLTREAEVRMLAVDGSRRLSGAIVATTAALRTALRDDDAVRIRAVCQRTLATISAARPFPLNLGVFDKSGRRLCATSGLSTVPLAAPAPGIGTEVRAIDGPDILRFTIGDLPQDMLAIGELPRSSLAVLVNPPVSAGIYGVRLLQGDAVIDLASPKTSDTPLGRKMSVATPVAGGQLSLELASPATPMRAIEILMILLPILMWLAAALIGWLVMDRLVLQPLGQLQRAITAYGGGMLELPTLTTPSMEIRALADAFANVTRTLVAHETELESGLARQTKLTREVHHRVKNNLQVVASLINLHSRGAANAQVGAAYAAIQRRVDALAVVHRNHYAELEQNRGVGVRPLLGELATNLRATAPAEAEHMAITLDLLPAFVSQDVAVPVAFFVTELAELAMECDPGGGVAIRLSATDQADRALLSVRSRGLTDEACRDNPSLARASRVIEGLSRQLRAPIARESESGGYAIVITIVPQIAATGA